MESTHQPIIDERWGTATPADTFAHGKRTLGYSLNDDKRALFFTTTPFESTSKLTGTPKTPNCSARAIACPVDCSRIFLCRYYAYAVVRDKDCIAVLVALRIAVLDVDIHHRPLRWANHGKCGRTNCQSYFRKQWLCDPANFHFPP